MRFVARKLGGWLGLLTADILVRLVDHLLERVRHPAFPSVVIGDFPRSAEFHFDVLGGQCRHDSLRDLFFHILVFYFQRLENPRQPKGIDL